MPNKTKREKGGLLVEIAIVVAIIVVALTFFVGLAAAFLVTSQIVQQSSKAVAMAQGALEIVRNYRDGTDWTVDGLGTFTLGDPYHPEQSGGAWTLVTGAETMNEFTRTLEFEEVCRDGSDDIIPCGSPADPDTVKAVVTVSWQERGRNHEVRVESYFTNWK